jgi:hypothetical protein
VLIEKKEGEKEMSLRHEAHERDTRCFLSFRSTFLGHLNGAALTLNAGRVARWSDAPYLNSKNYEGAKIPSYKMLLKST